MKYSAHPLSVVEPGASIGDETRIWHFAHVRDGATIGAQCTIGKSAYVDSGVRLGNRVKVQNFASLFGNAVIEDGVFIGPHACLTNDKHPRAISPDGGLLGETQWRRGTVYIARGASVGAHATILSDVKIGTWAMVGAGSVVVRDVPPFALAYGTPGRAVGVVSPSGRVLARAYLPGTYRCPDTGLAIEILPEWCDHIAENLPGAPHEMHLHYSDV